MYRPGTLDEATLQALAASLRLELAQLALQFAQPADFVSLNTLYAPPKRIFDGQIVKADGVLWNPGSGAGVYCRIGTVWTKF